MTFFVILFFLVVGLICSMLSGVGFAKKKWGPAVAILLVALITLSAGVTFSVIYLGKGNPDYPVRMDKDSVYQLVWQGQIDGNPYAVMVEMEDIQELNSTDRSVRFYRLDQSLPPGTYYRCVKKNVDGVEKTLLEPFSLPAPATP